LELRPYFVRAVAPEGAADPYYKIPRRQLRLMLSKPVAQHTFHIIAVVGTFGRFFTDHQTKPRMPGGIGIGIRNLQ